MNHCSIQPAIERKTFDILIVEDDPVIRRGLVDYLNQYHPFDYELKTTACETVSTAKEAMAQHTFDLVISDYLMPEEDGFCFLSNVKKNYPDTRVVIITAYRLDDFIEKVKETGIYNIIAKTVPFNFEELSLVIDGLLKPGHTFGLERYLSPDTEISEFTISRSEHIVEAFTTLRAFMEANQVAEVDDLSTALMEAITNGVYHASKNDQGEDKYKKGSKIIELEPHEYVTVRYGRDDERIGISISDQGGQLTAEDCFYWLFRNFSGEGLLDTSGRGLFLMHSLADRFSININPGKQTEFILLNYFQDDYRSNKSLHINQLQPS
jgi:DNA-binding NarL/FixJ family response regulator